MMPNTECFINAGNNYKPSNKRRRGRRNGEEIHIQPRELQAKGHMYGVRHNKGCITRGHMMLQQHSKNSSPES